MGSVCQRMMFFLLLLARGDPLNLLVLLCQIDPNFLRIHLASRCAFLSSPRVRADHEDFSSLSEWLQFVIFPQP